MELLALVAEGKSAQTGHEVVFLQADWSFHLNRMQYYLEYADSSLSALEEGSNRLLSGGLVYFGLDFGYFNLCGDGVQMYDALVA
jgi:hypothetical protein